VESLLVFTIKEAVDLAGHSVQLKMLNPCGQFLVEVFPTCLCNNWHCSDSYGNHGCEGGDPGWTYPYIIAQGGMDSYAAYPYVGVDQTCMFNPSAVAAQIGNWGYITTTDNENEIGAWMYQYGPPSICVDATLWQYYTGGVVTTQSNCGETIDHCVQLVGWTTVSGIPAWTVRNSWGTSWGYAGYIYLERGYDICAMGDAVSSSVI